MPGKLRQPALVAHADWSSAAKKRWLCVALRDGRNAYRLFAPEPVGPLDDLLDRLKDRAGANGRVLFGFDFPLGVPLAYAKAVGINDFRRALANFGSGRWHSFFDVAARPRDITPWRPFYPARSGRARRRHLEAGLGLAFLDLLRIVDRPTPTRRAASAMFWTLGGQQVGKGALAGWRHLVAPAALRDDVRLWPFDGRLAALLRSAQVVLAEAYPAEYYRHLELPHLRGKRQQSIRAANGRRILSYARAIGIAIAPELRRQLATGFGPRPDGEDPFDAVVGALGLLNVVLGNRAPGEPDDPVIRAIEGWTLGQAP